jgi:hypothetical protein
MMKNSTKRVIALAGVLALGLSAAKAQEDGALLDALVKKGVLSDQEAQDIRASEAKDASTTAADKIAISYYVQKLTFYGDVRYRWEYADEKAVAGPVAASGGVVGGENIIERSRVRVRVGVDAQFTDNFKGGVELETGLNNDSANQTFGNAYGKAPISLGLAYLQWHPFDWVTLTGGKFHNPLYTPTNLRWDPDINPEGAAEQFSWTFPIGGGESAPVSRDPKDEKDLKAITPSGGSDESFTVGFTAFQGIYADNNEFAGGSNAFNKGDVWQFDEEIPVQFNFNKSTYIKFAPGFDTYTSGGNFGPTNVPSNAAVEDGNGVQNFSAVNAADDLAIITAPGEVDWKLGIVPFKFYWDFAANLDGKSRVQDVYLAQPPTGQVNTPITAQTQNRDLGDNIAWVAGLQLGANKKKGDWLVKADYRQVGLGSIDPNENDSDWGDSFLNQQGVSVSGSYDFTDFLIGTITVYDTWSYKSGLFANQNVSTLQVGNSTNVTSPTTSVVGLTGAGQTQRVDVDLQWKF